MKLIVNRMVQFNTEPQISLPPLWQQLQLTDSLFIDSPHYFQLRPKHKILNFLALCRWDCTVGHEKEAQLRIWDKERESVKKFPGGGNNVLWVAHLSCSPHRELWLVDRYQSG